MWNLLAQTSGDDAAAAAAAGGIMAGMGVMMLLYIAIIVTSYVSWAMCLSKIATRDGKDNAWWAWVPILNLVLLIQLVDLEMWWIIVCILCGIAIVYPMMKLAEKCGKESWWGIVAIIPCIGLIVPFQLMKSDGASSG